MMLKSLKSLMEVCYYFLYSKKYECLFLYLLKKKNTTTISFFIKKKKKIECLGFLAYLLFYFTSDFLVFFIFLFLFFFFHFFFL